MFKNNILITLYPFLVLIPFALIMFKMKKKLAIVLFVLLSIATSVVFYLTTEHITLTRVITFALSVLGCYGLLFSGIKLKDSDTKRRIEANVILLMLGMGFYVVTNPLVVAPIFVIALVYMTLVKFYPCLLFGPSFLKLKQAFFTTKYSLESGVDVDESIKPEVYPE